MLLAPWIKLIGAFATLILSVIFGFVARHRIFLRNPSILGLANIAGGGVLLGITFTHLLPEVVEGYNSIDNDYPLGYVLVLFGYLGLVILEKVLFHHKPSIGGPNDEDQQLNTDSRLLPEITGEVHKGNIITPIMLLIALSVHSLFEGLVFGLQETDTNALAMMFAILSHKPVETLFLGIVMVKEYVKLSTHIVLVTILSIITPTGICIGVALDTLDVSETTTSTFSAIAAGTFLYISTTEIISEELHSCTNAVERWKKFICLCLGVTFILVLHIWLGEHEHDHDHDH